MRVTFFSSYLNHHQLPFCLAMQRETEGMFTFVATEKISQKRLEMGYEDMDRKYPFVLIAYEDAARKKEAMRLALESDVVILGSAPDRYIEKRLKQRKLTFKYNERFFKTPMTWKNYGKRKLGAWLYHGRFQAYPLYMLAASAYTAWDCARFKNYPDRVYRWGYFPQVKEQEPDMLFQKKKQNPKPTLLWAGRFLDWKHPDDAVCLAEDLKKAGYDFRLDLIGNGDMQQTLETMIRRKGLQEQVSLLGAMPPEKVRTYMEQADIYLLTSDFGEGWGAVLNEAMNSGCAVAASHAVGSVPFLLQHGKNGMIYENGNHRQLLSTVSELLEQPEKRRQLGQNAYETLRTLWNADTAAARLMQLAEQLQETGDSSLFETGPCSKAAVIKNDDIEKIIY